MADLDPAPRVYPPAVTLVRRIGGDGAPPAAPTTVEEVERWLFTGALTEADLLALFHDLVRRLVAAGLPLDRMSLHAGTLHPQIYCFTWQWLRADGLTDEAKVDEASLRTDAYRRSALYRVIELGETVRARTADAAARTAFPLMADLAAQGIVEYVALPLGGAGKYHNAATVATSHPAGFSEDQFTALRRLLMLFALHVERHIVLRIANHVADTYLGRAAGGRVLDGSIKRGSGEAIRAVIWMSDLRGFTGLSDRLPGPAVTAVLNAYFDALAGAVLGHGGEVLKFLGDGLLAVFPIAAGEDGAARAAAQALAAARQALADLDALNAAPPDDLGAIEGWRPLATGIALHLGEVFFGNVGAPDRLDFTVIGRAVNEAARVEALCKELGRPVLITAPVARLLREPLDHLGEHPLRGVAAPVSIYGPVG
ncbi:MAG: adenylate/guanylate cyclase domain-containing protein [Rhodospirillaceae bacterium]|nr:adenylate/guanylate cyclase domain-containing protein [Rhodospirillaceae bacterium]